MIPPVAFPFRVVVQLPGHYPTRAEALQAARRLYGLRVVRVVSNASDAIGLEEADARARNHRLRLVDLDTEEDV